MVNDRPATGHGPSRLSLPAFPPRSSSSESTNLHAFTLSHTAGKMKKKKKADGCTCQSSSLTLNCWHEKGSATLSRTTNPSPKKDRNPTKPRAAIPYAKRRDFVQIFSCFACDLSKKKKSALLAKCRIVSSDSAQIHRPLLMPQ